MPEHHSPRCSEAWLGERDRLKKVLHLDTGVLANPLTALTIFTPLITSVLAAFVPQLGSAIGARVGYGDLVEEVR